MSVTTLPFVDASRSNPRIIAPAALACMGIVFGDIGTSPLYTLQVAVKAASPDGVITPAAVLGIVSLIFWSLIIVISIKYASLIMRASNHGEGGILALVAMLCPKSAKPNRRRAIMLIIGLVGATLLYGDGAITPAISVLSALEGIKLFNPATGALGHPSDTHHSDGFILDSEEGDDVDRSAVRSRHVNLVHRDWQSGHDWHCQRACDPRRVQSYSGDRLSLARRPGRLGSDRERVFLR